MGFFEKFKLSSAYDKMLSRFGVNSRDIPASVNAKICGYAEQNYKRRAASASYYNDGAEGLVAEVQNAAILVAYCVLGKTAFRKSPFLGNNISLEEMMVRDAAKAWSESGPESTLGAMIINTLNDAELLSEEFTNEFNLLLE